jgi:phage tail sheath protein FI
MPVTTSYPGIYLEELPSNAHTITAAPTSIAVFIGYTHPFKTRAFDTAVELFSFSDYEREFGGLYASGALDSSVAYAVNQFFLNGGSFCYVVGLQADYHVGPAPGTTQAVVAPSLTLGGGMVLTAREPTDLIPMLVTIELPPGPAGATGDLTITYGNQIETFRGVSVDSTNPNFIENVVGTPLAPRSSLVTVSPTGAGYPATMPSTTATPIPMTIPVSLNSTFSADDFTDALQADQSLDKVAIFNLISTPGVTDVNVTSAMLSFAERKLAFGIVDAPRQAAADSTFGLPEIADQFEQVPKSTNGALYFPWVEAIDPITSQPMEQPPCGVVAGKYSAVDLRRGVWKAPAGIETSIGSITGVVARGRMANERQGLLNPVGINCLRTFRDTGTVIFGARTLVAGNTAFEQWRYVPVRRMALFIEQSLVNSLGWAVFEPNDDPLWTALRTTINNFMLSLFNQQAFQGSTPSQAFKVVCDATTTTQTDIDSGRVNILVAFAPLKPAEFVVIRIAQLAGQTQS